MATLRKIDNDPTALSEADLKAIEEGRADIAAGRYVDHKDMVAWLKTWGSEPRRPTAAPQAHSAWPGNRRVSAAKAAQHRP